MDKVILILIGIFVGFNVGHPLGYKSCEYDINLSKKDNEENKTEME